MGTANWQPKWWKPETHGSAWERVKEALKRDWEQTKADMHAGGRELHQNIGDTAKQMAGKEAIPPANVPNAPNATNATSQGAQYTPNAPGGSDQKARSWDEVETPMMYGYGAREQYGAQHTGWNDRLEGTLKTEWEEGRSKTGKTWDEVRDYVRRGYERHRPGPRH